MEPYGIGPVSFEYNNLMRDTVYNGSVQELTYEVEVGGEMVRWNKNAETILEDRGLDSEGNMPELKARLLECDDFKDAAENPPMWLQEVIEAWENNYMHLNPKFHCEINPIENVWAFMKQLFRSSDTDVRDDGTKFTAHAWACLHKVPHVTIARYINKAIRTIDGYHKEFVKAGGNPAPRHAPYTSHHRAPRVNEDEERQYDEESYEDDEDEE
jgi:hypothetical protein